MENQTSQIKHSDEIDLIDLISKMGKSVKNFFLKIVFLFQHLLILLILKVLWIFSFTFIGLIVGIFFFLLTPRFYSSQMIARSNSLNNNVIVNSINLLNDLFDNKNYLALAGFLEIKTSEASRIKSIEAFYGIDVNNDKVVDYIDYNNRYNPKDSLQKRLPDIFYVKINVFDESIFPNLRDGIKKYISTNPYIVKNNEIRKSQENILINEYGLEIKKIDSLQKVQYFELPKIQRATNNQLVFLNEKETKLFHNDIIMLYKRKLELEKDLALYPDPVTIIQDFTQLSKAENSFVRIILVFVSVFALIGFLTALFWDYKEKIYTAIKTH